MFETVKIDILIVENVPETRSQMKDMKLRVRADQEDPT